MAEFSDILSKLVLVMIIVFSSMLFIVSLQVSDSAPQQLAENSIFNDSLSGLTAEIASATSEADDKYTVFNSETPKEDSVSIILFGIVSVTKSFSNIVLGFFTTIIKLPLVVFGIPQAIVNLILVMLVIVLVVSIWRVLKLGG